MKIPEAIDAVVDMRKRLDDGLGELEDLADQVHQVGDQLKAAFTFRRHPLLRARSLPYVWRIDDDSWREVSEGVWIREPR